MFSLSLSLFLPYPLSLYLTLSFISFDIQSVKYSDILEY